MKRYKAIADYYDTENERHEILKHDVPFFLGQLPYAGKRRQDILEIAVGTGRAAIPIAQAGHRVVGVDYAQDMLEIARRKRDAVGLSEEELQILHQDATKLALDRQFDWICIFFNTMLAFVTLGELDALLDGVRRHLRPRGRLWIDLFNPDHHLLARERERGLERDIFFVPELQRTVFRETDITRDTARQVMRVLFKYLWFDSFGKAHREKFEFDMGIIYPRELQLLIERHGMRIEHLWGNYDGEEFTNRSPRMIARCMPA